MKVLIDITEHEANAKLGRWEFGDCYGYIRLESGDSYCTCDCCDLTEWFTTLRGAAEWIAAHEGGSEDYTVVAYDEVSRKPIKQLGRRI